MPKALLGRNTARPKLPIAPKNVAGAPLNSRDRTLQLLDRFTFGARPGELERVIAMGADKWFEQQLEPNLILDNANDKRMADFPTLSMTPEQALRLFPDRGAIARVADAKIPRQSIRCWLRFTRCRFSNTTSSRITRSRTQTVTSRPRRRTQRKPRKRKKIKQRRRASQANCLLCRRISAWSR